MKNKASHYKKFVLNVAIRKSEKLQLKSKPKTNETRRKNITKDFSFFKNLLELFFLRLDFRLTKEYISR